MLWTFVAFIAVLAVLILHFLKKVIQTITEKYFVYPSEAHIDQALPEEIMEHVMTYMDPLGLLESRFVSKYWRYNAMKPRVQKEVLDSYERTMKSAPLPSIDLDAVLLREPDLWFDYSKYSKTLLLRDRALAVLHGKQLLEISPAALRSVVQAFEKDKEHADKYIIKAMMFKSSMESDQRTISLTGDFRETLTFPEVNGREWASIPYCGGVDGMFDVSSYLAEHSKLRQKEVKVYSVRNRDPRKYFGFVPLDGDFMQVLVFLLAPLIVHDVLRAAFLSVVKAWLGPIMFLVVCVLNFMLVRDFNHSSRRLEGVYGRAAIIFMLGYVALTALAYPYSMTYHATAGMVGFSFIYVVLIYEYTNSRVRYVKVDTRDLMPAIVAAALVLVMNDWKLAVDSVKNGVIWFTLFNNVVAFALMCLHFVALNALSYIGNHQRWDFEFLIKWDPSATKMVLQSTPIILFLTLYAPTWRGNHV